MEIISNGYKYYQNEIINQIDKRNGSYPLANSPVATFMLLLIYLYFVLYYGPKFMQNRKPFNLKRIIQIYDFAQILLCGYITMKCIQTVHGLSWKCSEIKYSMEEPHKTLVHIGHMYIFTKVLDLLDTVFFVLRKKQNHVSFLHVYHHAMMLILVTYGQMYYAGGHSVYLVYANSFVHVVMYTYYLIASINQNYVNWLKKYITQLQLIQFVFLVFIYTMPLITESCKFPRSLSLLMIAQALLMIYLFSSFYYKAYILKSKHKTV